MKENKSNHTKDSHLGLKKKVKRETSRKEKGEKRNRRSWELNKAVLSSKKGNTQKVSKEIKRTRKTYDRKTEKDQDPTNKKNKEHGSNGSPVCLPRIPSEAAGALRTVH